MTNLELQLDAALMFPKGKRRKKKNKRGYSKTVFRKKVVKADNNRCANRNCLSVCTYRGDLLHAHHIKFSSQGGPDTVENGISLCPTCHERAHQGYTNVVGERVTARAFMIDILEKKQNEATFRWEEALDYLRKRAKGMA